MEKPRLGRLGRRKTSTGCKTCKIRRVKCDENRPVCNRCTSTGRRCDGYADLFQFYHPTNLRSAFEIYGLASDNEVRSFEYFMQQVIPGFSRNVDAEFWHVLIPQFSHLDQIVWDSVVAMSILFQGHRLSDNTPADCKLEDALTYYHRSLKKLQRQIKRSNGWTMTCELTAIIYICIECQQDNPDGAKMIYQRVVNAIKANEEPFSADELRVRKAVGTLLRHMAISQGAPVPLHQLSPSGYSSPLLVSRDRIYEIVFEAHRFVCQVMEIKIPQPKHWVPPEALVQSQVSLQQELQTWRAALAAPHLVDQSDREVYSVMMLVYHQYRIWLPTCLSMFETIYDDFFTDFEAMIHHAQMVISATQQQSVFSFETRVLPSLFFVASKCRDPRIRRQAISLLKAGPRMENTHSAANMIRIAQKAIGIEEAGHQEGIYQDACLSSSPPESHRIHRLLEVELPGSNEKYLDIGGWHQLDGNWCRFDSLVKV